MPLNIGEVEAVLRARDQFSDVFVAAAQRAQQLLTMLKNLGDDAGPQMQKIEAALIEVEKELNRMQDAGEHLATTMKEKVGPAAGTAAAEQQRLIEVTRQGVEAANAGSAAQETQAKATDANTAAIQRQIAAAKEAETVRAAAASGYAPLAGSPLPPITGAIPVAGGGAYGGPSLSASEAYIESLRRQTLEYKPLTDAQNQYLLQLAQMNQLTQTNAEKVGVNAVQYKQYKAALDDTDTGIKTVGQSMQQMEGIAQRLIERMVILWAVRGVMQFVEGVFQAADALRLLHDQTGLSLELLQVLQFGAERTSVPFEKITAAVDTFDKKLAGTSSDTLQSLDIIGMSFDSVFKLKPDERFNAVASAIAAIPDKMTRTGVEVKLFGTDAIDPLIMRLGSLREEAEKSNHVLGDDTINALSGTYRAFKDVTLTVTDLASQLLVAAQKAVEFGATPFFRWLTTGTPLPPNGLKNLVPEQINAPLTPAEGRAVQQFMASGESGEPDSASRFLAQSPALKAPSGDIQLVPEATEFPEDPRVAKIAQIRREASEATKALTADQRAWLDELQRDNVLTADNAALQNVTLGQFKAYEQSLHNAKTATTELVTETGRWADVEKLWQQAAQAEEAIGNRGLEAQLANLDKEQAAEVAGWNKKLAQAEAGGKATGAIYEQYNQAVEAIEERYAARRESLIEIESQKELRQWQKSEDDVEKLRDEADAAELESTATGLAKKLLQIDAGLQKQRDTWKKSLDAGTTDEEHYWQAIYEIDRKGIAQREQALNDALRRIEHWGEGAPLTGPIPGEPLFKVDPKIHDGFQQWVKDLSELTAAFRNLAQVSDGTFKGFVQGVAQVLAAANVVAKGIDTFNKPKAEGQSESSYMLQRGTGILSMATGFAASTGSGNMGQDMAGGAISGAEIGMEFGGPPGMIVGAIVGTVVGVIRNLFKDHMPDDIARDAGAHFGQVWSDALQKTVLANAKRLKDELAGEIASLPQIIQEHPVDLSNLSMYESKVHDIFSMLETGHFTVAEATNELDQVFPQLAEVATDAYGRIDDGLKEIIRLNDEWGTHSKAIADFEKTQGQNILAGFQQVADALIPSASDYDAAQQKLEDVNAAIADLESKQKKGTLTHRQQEQLADLYDQRPGLQATVNAFEIGPSPGELAAVGSQAVGAYVTAAATGTSKADAIKAESKALTDLEREYKILGIAVEDNQLKTLFLFNDIGKIAPTLLPGLEGLQKEMIGLDNLSLETADSFQTQEKSGYAMYVHLQSVVASLGGGTKEALAPMQDYLHQAVIEAEKLGVPLDENTQMMVDQSKELGIWDDHWQKTKDSTEKLADAVEKLVNWLDKITDHHSTVTTDFEERHHSDNSGGAGSSSGDGTNQSGGGGDEGTGSNTTPPPTPGDAEGGIVAQPHASYTMGGQVGHIVQFPQYRVRGGVVHDSGEPVDVVHATHHDTGGMIGQPHPVRYSGGGSVVPQYPQYQAQGGIVHSVVRGGDTSIGGSTGGDTTSSASSDTAFTDQSVHVAHMSEGGIVGPPAHSASTHTSHTASIGQPAAQMSGGGIVVPYIPRGTDIAPIMATPGEGVLSLRGMDFIGGERGLAAINRGGEGISHPSLPPAYSVPPIVNAPIFITAPPPTAAPNVTIQVTCSVTIDKIETGMDVARVKDELIPVINHIWDHNIDELRTKTQGVMGLKII